MFGQKGLGGNVISLDFGKLDISYPAIAQSDAYWVALAAKGRRLPERSQIDPRAIEDCLEYAFILERIAPGIARFRVAGQHLGDLVGLDVHGMPLSVMFAPPAFNKLAGVIEKTCVRPCRSFVALSAQKKLGQPDLAGMLYLAPLLSEHGHVDRIFGCLQTRGRLGRVPRKFVISDVATKGCSPVAELSTDEPPRHIPKEALTQALPQKKGPDASRPALRLVSDNG